MYQYGYMSTRNLLIYLDKRTTGTWPIYLEEFIIKNIFNFRFF